MEISTAEDFGNEDDLRLTHTIGLSQPDHAVDVAPFNAASAMPALALAPMGARISSDADEGLKVFPFLRKAQHMSFGGKTAVPVGYFELCTTDAKACRASSGWIGSWSYSFGIQLDHARMNDLIKVNNSVNRSMRERTDRALYRVADKWAIGQKAGDCEDFALTKKAQLVAKGWPSSALLVALATTRAGLEHAVLIARTDHGDLVLDSLRSDIRGWSPSLYRWRTVQAPSEAWNWYAIRIDAPVAASRTTTSDTDHDAVAIFD